MSPAWCAASFALVALPALGATACVGSDPCTNCEANLRAVASAETDPEPAPMGTMVAEPEPEPAPAPRPPSAEPYANCLSSTTVCQHGESPHCLADDAEAPTMAFCTSDCGSTQECPRAPDVNGAQPKCLSLDGAGGECVLECLGGDACPSGMVCLPFGVCGYVTDLAENPYANCLSCPDDTLGCLSSATGEVCLPRCSDPCPAARNGAAAPSCLEAGGQFGCALECEGYQRCPDGMVCSQIGPRWLCQWPHENPCNVVDCPADRVCDVFGGQPVCLCAPNLAESPTGECVDPCDLALCDPSARCEPLGSYARCVCDEKEEMDPMGVCREVPDPCEPNPCAEPTSRCVAVGAEPVCGCPDPQTSPPSCEERCTLSHSDGDVYEPNDCYEDSTLLFFGLPSQGPVHIDADFGPELDDVDLYRLTYQPGLYWVLLAATEPVCALDFEELPNSGEFGSYSFGLQTRGDLQGAPWACRYREELQSVAAYRLGVMFFPVFGDLPDSQEQVPDAISYLFAAGTFEIADRFSDDADVDAFAFQVELPGTFSFTGQRASIEIDVRQEDGENMSLDVECGFTLEPQNCVDVAGEGRATLLVTVRQAESATQSALDAWRLGW